MESVKKTLPGLLLCLVLAVPSWLLGHQFPVVDVYKRQVLSTLYWPQLVLFDQRASVRLRNALLFTVKNFWATLGVCLLQLAWWLLMVLFAPWTLILVPLVAVWFDLFAALFLLYDRLDAAFGIEAGLAQAFPDQVPRRDC